MCACKDNVRVAEIILTLALLLAFWGWCRASAIVRERDSTIGELKARLTVTEQNLRRCLRINQLRNGGPVDWMD